LPEDIQGQLVKHLTDVHSIEEQALVQMRRAPEIAGDEQLAETFRRHLGETEGHERRVRDRLAAHDAKPSKLKDLAGKAGGMPMVLFARSQPDTPGKLVAHAFSYEHMEEAAYEIVRRVAERAGDADTAAVALTIGDEERLMSERLESSFDLAVEASLRTRDSDDPADQIDDYLADAHALEQQAIELLRSGSKLAEADGLATLFSDHLAETRRHEQGIETRLEARGAGPSAVKDAALRLGGLNYGGLLGAQPDTPAKLTAFAFAFEHLEIAAYELLARIARRAGDEQTAELAESILSEERTMAQRIRGHWDLAVQAALHSQGVAASAGD
jgi:ferritin-like metal-binding protein YciE